MSSSRHHLEKMTIFMEADAPFPDPETDTDTSPSKAVLSNIYASPKYSRDGSGSQTSENDGGSSTSSSQKMPSKKVRFGGTTPQHLRVVGIIEEGDENVEEEEDVKESSISKDVNLASDPITEGDENLVENDNELENDVNMIEESLSPNSKNDEDV